MKNHIDSIKLIIILFSFSIICEAKENEYSPFLILGQTVNKSIETLGKPDISNAPDRLTGTGSNLYHSKKLILYHDGHRILWLAYEQTYGFYNPKDIYSTPVLDLAIGKPIPKQLIEKYELKFKPAFGHRAETEFVRNDYKFRIVINSETNQIRSIYLSKPKLTQEVLDLVVEVEEVEVEVSK